MLACVLRSSASPSAAAASAPRWFEAKFSEVSAHPGPSEEENEEEAEDAVGDTDSVGAAASGARETHSAARPVAAEGGQMMNKETRIFNQICKIITRAHMNKQFCS